MATDLRDPLDRARAMSVKQRRALFAALPSHEQEHLLALAMHHISLSRKNGHGSVYAEAAKEANIQQGVAHVGSQ